MTRDADFSEATKRIIAKRAGYRCSFPSCGRTTIGPGSAPDQVEQTGHAAHIFAATDGEGPRGTGGLSSADRKKPENGIWMCATHAGLIDQQLGQRYPQPELQRWKATHEARIDHEHRSLPLPLGWVSRIDIVTSPLFEPNTKLELGKVTLLFGRNATGKTAVCDWLATSAGLVQRTIRWMHHTEGRESVNLRLHYSNPTPKILLAKIDQDGASFSSQDGSALLDLSHALSVVFVSNDLVKSELERVDALECLARACGVHRQSVVQALTHLKSLDLPHIKEIQLSNWTEEQLKEDHPDEDFSEELSLLGLKLPQRLNLKIDPNDEALYYPCLSSTEKSIAKISLGVTLAHLNSLHRPTLLIIDLGANQLNDELIAEYAELLSAPRFGFQTIFVTQREHPTVQWTGWSIATFAGIAPRVTCDQNWWGDTPPVTA